MNGEVSRKVWDWFKEDARYGFRVDSAEGRYIGGFPTANSLQEAQASIDKLLFEARGKLGQAATESAIQDEVNTDNQQEE
jgi:hypothetical protein